MFKAVNIQTSFLPNVELPKSQKPELHPSPLSSLDKAKLNSESKFLSSHTKTLLQTDPRGRIIPSSTSTKLNDLEISL